MTVMKTGQTTFLAFTICPSFNDAYNQTVFEKFNTTKSNYLNGNFYPNTTAFFDTVAYDITQIMENVRIVTGEKSFII